MTRLSLEKRGFFKRLAPTGWPFLYNREMEDEIKRIKRMISAVRSPKKPKRIPEEMTPEEVLGFFAKVSNGRRISRDEYDRLRPPMSPCAKTIIRTSGKSWGVLCDEMWGKNERPKIEDVDEIYLIKVFLEFGIKTENEWKAKRKAYPHIVPSVYYIRTLFGEFVALRKVAEKYDIKRNLLKCLEVKLRLGRPPTMKDYEDEGVNVRYLKKKFLNLTEVNRKVRMLEEGFNEISRRDKKEGGQSCLKDVQREAERAFEPFSSQLRS